MKAFLEVYNLDDGDRRYRFTLKGMLFLTLLPPYSSCIVIRREALEEKQLKQCFNWDIAVKHAAETMKNANLCY